MYFEVNRARVFEMLKKLHLLVDCNVFTIALITKRNNKRAKCMKKIKPQVITNETKPGRKQVSLFYRAMLFLSLL